MWCDAVDLRDFYRTVLGQMARRVIRQHLRRLWPDVRGQRVLGLGYATPYLLSFREEAERVVSVMPAQQGVLHWPADAPNLVALSHEDELPFPDVMFDRVLLVHALECSERLRPMLREVWRVMADGAKLLLVVPNRLSMWSMIDRTPFGQGHPYTLTQITRLMRDNLFTPTESSFALFVPPTIRRVVVHSAPAWEKVGVRLVPHLGGVVLVEAAKQIYAGAPVVATARHRRLYMPVAGSPERQSFAGAVQPAANRSARGLRAPRRDATIASGSAPPGAARDAGRR
jgi:SAM-dependent methyltransferase